jgi:hypothetical protein
MLLFTYCYAGLTLHIAGGSISFEEAAMPQKVRVNLANPAELLELPGVGPEQARAILKFRAEHGPIKDPAQLATILGPWPIAAGIWEHVEFDPADNTAPEAPGA